jgi:hypothetical protein
MIRLVTVIGHGLELLPHFINHYQKYVDEIHIVAYRSELHPTIDFDIDDIIQNYNNIQIVKSVYHRVFDWEKVTKLYNQITSKYKNDWWVVADIDEFHLYPNNDLKKLVWDCEENGWDIVRGGFIDRIGKEGTFPKINGTEDIWKQFPNMGFFRYPMSGACPNKICVMRGWVELTNGQHYVNIDGHTTWKWQGWGHPLIAPIETHSVQVHHFKWDVSCIERIKKVADLNKEYSYSNEYMQMYKELEKSKFLIDIYKNEFMFENSAIAEFNKYKGWNKLIKKIVSL